ncbi:hypothetical protein BYT27DRAFT_7194912 [Phlegmacium glaucopus]|nr:hypothetical protein BYT27DRAFT_7194912 [Phlegmacium glaucopus]
MANACFITYMFMSASLSWETGICTTKAMKEGLVNQVGDSALDLFGHCDANKDPKFAQIMRVAL